MSIDEGTAARSLWAEPPARQELPFTDNGIESAPAFSPSDFVERCQDLVAPFMKPLSIEALSTPTQDK